MFHSFDDVNASFLTQTSAHATNSFKHLDTLDALSLIELSYLEPSQIRPHQRFSVMTALRKKCSLGRGVSLNDCQVKRLVMLCQYLCDWPFIIMLIEKGLWTDASLESVMPFVMVGDNKRAIDRLTSIKDSLNDSIMVNKLIQELRNEDLPSLASEGMTLIPLKAHHVADFIWQYADPSIAHLCNLPKFTNPSAWLRWWHQCNRDKRQHLFAVLHPQFGFAGSVSIHVCSQYGFFYYWLGEDFRGQGIGPMAVNTLLQHVKQTQHIKGCFTKIYEQNKASHHAVAKLAFFRLPFFAQPSDEHEVFYYRGEFDSEENLKVSLQAVLNELNAGILLK